MCSRRHPDGGRFLAAECESRSADANDHRVARRPHAGDDFASRTRHESEIAQACQQYRSAAPAIIEAGDLRQTLDNTRLAASQFGEGRRGSGCRIRAFHDPQYEVGPPACKCEEFAFRETGRMHTSLLIDMASNPPLVSRP